MPHRCYFNATEIHRLLYNPEMSNNRKNYFFCHEKLHPKIIGKINCIRKCFHDFAYLTIYRIAYNSIPGRVDKI